MEFLVFSTSLIGMTWLRVRVPRHKVDMGLQVKQDARMGLEVGH